VIALLQRVSDASVTVGTDVVGEIGAGLLVFLAIEPTDTPAEAERLVERVTTYRVFPDEQDRMNLGLADTGGGLLLVPQFTLAADTSKGLRPSFASAAAPEQGRALYEHAVQAARVALGARVASGRFGAHMRVRLTNDGPVTFWLHVRRASQGSAR
jgi:D-aminoacyl-tRNA deacylase